MLILVDPEAVLELTLLRTEAEPRDKVMQAEHLVLFMQQAVAAQVAAVVQLQAVQVVRAVAAQLGLLTLQYIQVAVVVAAAFREVRQVVPVAPTWEALVADQTVRRATQVSQHPKPVEITEAAVVAAAVHHQDLLVAMEVLE
jgi:hypothetical protein